MEKGFRDGRPQELPQCTKRTSRATRHSGPRTASGQFFALGRRGPLAMAAGCALVPASTAGPVHALRRASSPRCWLPAADPRAEDASGLTAIDLARRYGNADALALLYSRSDPPPCGRLCTADFWKSADPVATARRLLLRAADPNWSKYDGPAVLSGEGERPLHVAVHFPEVVKLLLEHGADPDGRMPFTGTTPLHLAAGSCEAASLALLLARGPDPNARDEHGDTPLTHAVRRVANAGTVEWETWRKICEANTSWEDPERCIAVNHREYVRKYEPREECEEIVSTLMRHGARTDIPGYGGYPPLEQAWLLGLEDEALRWFHLAAEQGHVGAQASLGHMYTEASGSPRTGPSRRAGIDSRPSRDMPAPRTVSGCYTARARGFRKTTPRRRAGFVAQPGSETPMLSTISGTSTPTARVSPRIRSKRSLGAAPLRSSVFRAPRRRRSSSPAAETRPSGQESSRGATGLATSPR